MDATKPGDFGPDGKVNVNLKIVFADAGVASGGGKGPPDLLPPSNLVPSKRFNVELLVGGRPLEQGTTKDESSEYHNVFFAVVPKELRLGTEEAEYQIRLTNRGEPGLPFENERDRERLFAAAVTIAGVNSIWQEGAGGRIGPVSRHPQFLTKWVLSGPGQRVEFLRNGAHRLVGAPADRDGSRVTVAGYQVKGETRKRFVFGSAEESVAVRSGVTHEIGVITVYFFAQKLKDDHVYTSRPVNVGGPDAPPLGTLAGREERNLVQPIRLELYEQPTEVWRIFYRREGDRFPVPPDDRIPVTDVLEGKRTPEV
jgi:hypothetical protein